MRHVGSKSNFYIGEVSDEELPWRGLLHETDPDDEELPITPQDVIDVLGFDPKEFSRKKPRTTLNTLRAKLILKQKG